jgi:hypothetical protein
MRRNLSDFVLGQNAVLKGFVYAGLQRLAAAA